MNTVEKFISLVNTYDVQVDHDTKVGSTGYLDKPVLNTLFTGKDEYGRLFINLPIKLKKHTRCGTTEVHMSCDTAFTVFQRYRDNENVFVTGAAPAVLNTHRFVGENHNDLTGLEKLLSGKTLTIHANKWLDDGTWVPDTDSWVTISLTC